MVFEPDPSRMDDCLIAEHVEGYRRVPGPTTDYDGPCESYEVLVPPHMTGGPSGNVFSDCPPRGAIAPYYWVPDYSCDRAACERLLARFADRHGGDVSVVLEVSKNCFVCRVGTKGEHFAFSGSLMTAVRTAMLGYVSKRMALVRHADGGEG